MELADHVESGLAHVDPYFVKLAEAMRAWIACWRKLNPGTNSQGKTGKVAAPAEVKEGATEKSAWKGLAGN